MKSKKQLNIFALAIPLFFETAVNLVLYITDTFFLSQVSDIAAGAVGALVPVLGLVVFGYQAFAQSASSVAAQFLSAGSNALATRSCYVLIFMSATAGLVFSVLFYLLADFVGPALGLSDIASGHTSNYLLLLGPFLFIQFLRIGYGAILSFRGLPAWPMTASFMTAGLNVVLNALFLSDSGFLASFNGVEKVAIATILAQMLGLLVVVVKVHSLAAFRDKSLQRNKQPTHEIARSMLAVAMPSTVEPVSTEFLFIAQIVIIATFGDAALVAHTYAFNISLLVVVISTSLALATQIIVSHAIGSKNFNEAYSVAISYFKLVLIIGFLAGLSLWYFAEPIVSVLTTDREVIEIASTLLLISLVVQIGVAANLVCGMALRTTTDSRYSAVMGFLVMWLVGLPAMLFCGLVLQAGVVGVWVGKSVDEGVRGYLHVRRWSKKIWVEKAERLQSRHDVLPDTTKPVEQVELCKTKGI
ncbi:MATE family efflux transporter [uncultured Tateyamaria sp.]|uniref:MATE family efflux transporter n=1 Tax=uncultured Tateyamaria sp. TaxID=455651 RepID=UPI0026213243|nr:MATE family efflux transporter [uncultured Tateyamaria sp.]